MPEEYSIGAPKNSSSMGVSGRLANCSSNDSNPAMSPPTDRQRSNPSVAETASTATSARLAEAINNFALQFVMMYAVSSCFRCVLMGVKMTQVRFAACAICKNSTQFFIIMAM